jgi:hypothetical protein
MPLEARTMPYLSLMKTTRRLLTAGAFLSLIFVAGCDERVQITRDRDVHIGKHATWAWRPAVEEAAVPTRDNRANDNRPPVISRDDIGRDQRNRPSGNQPPAKSELDPNDIAVRERVKNAIVQTLTSKGFSQVSDPAAADFLVDYKFAEKSHSATVPVGYGGGYPGLVCGPFRCWESWGYGPAYVGYENIRFREGTIVFDWVQQSTKHLVYRAVGEKPVHRDAFSLTQGDINGLVHLLLEDLKPHK